MAFALGPRRRTCKRGRDHRQGPRLGHARQRRRPRRGQPPGHRPRGRPPTGPRPSPRSASTPRSPSTTPPSPATRTLEALRDLDEEDPADVEARGQGLSFIQLEGTIGCMVNGAGLAMTTMDLVEAGRRRAGQLPRHRRRRTRGQGRGRDAAHPRRRQRARRSWSTSSAASRAATRSPAAWSRPALSRRATCPWSCASWARTPTEAAAILRGRQRHRDRRQPRRRPWRRRSRAAAGRRAMSILVDRVDPPPRPGHHRSRGRVPRPPDAGLRHQRRRRRDARQGRPAGARRPRARLRHGRRGGRARRAPTRASSTSRPPGAPDAILEAVDAGIGTDLLHHRGHPRARHAQGRARRRGRRARGSSGPTAPAPPRPGKAKVGHHPGLHPPRGSGGPRQPLGHPHLRGRPGA